MSELDAETARLRERLGKGARYDSSAAPAHELAWARRGTAYFARKLNELADDELMAGSDLGLMRRRIACRIGHEARALAQIVEWTRLGKYSPATDPLATVEHSAMQSASLPAAAIRHLFKHAEVHLNVEWRDLDAAGWGAAITLPGGRPLAIRDTPALRAVSIWQSTVDLKNGGSAADFPPELDAFMRSGAAKTFAKAIS